MMIIRSAPAGPGGIGNIKGPSRGDPSAWRFGTFFVPKPDPKPIRRVKFAKLPRHSTPGSCGAPCSSWLWEAQLRALVYPQSGTCDRDNLRLRSWLVGATSSLTLDSHGGLHVGDLQHLP